MAASPAPHAFTELVIDSPGHTSMRIRLEKDRYKLGRSATNDLSFPADQSLSREHLVFERTPEGWNIRDLASRNGTLLNGSRLSDAMPLKHGDRITAGHLSIRYDAQGEFPDARPASVQFVQETAAKAVPSDTVTADLHSALQTTARVADAPAAQDMHFGALIRAGRELAGHCPLQELFQLVLNLAIDAVKAARGALVTLEAGNQFKTRAVRGEGLRISTAITDRVIAGRKSLLVRDTSADEDFAQRHSILAQQIRSFLAVPLQTDEHVIGFLYLDSPNWVREFTVNDLNLVTVMANIAAIRIEHARLIEAEQKRIALDRELERAAEIQRRLLPASAPEVAGLDMAGYNAPCRTVGGDYYDFLPYPDGRVGLFIGDVSGKGMGAALLMSSLQARTRVLFQEPDGLSAQVTRLNRITAGNCPSNCFITFCAATVDPATGDLTYCNAGHNAPLLVHAGGDFELLDPTGIILGILPNAAYEEKSRRLEPGDVLLLFSDGVTEACRPDCDEEFGQDRLVALLQEHRGQPASDILNAIKTGIASYTGGCPAADDITLVVARRL
ncbi:MAG TPA: SpoIIE family protein phosphatase [Bryobacteraceae bacterium]|jgi:serine phosphatase RsbU (regulator of sigma subunit)|nr:SpoIIE family protein phosphatase [Bryobacteraceae bacterium]